MVHIQGRLSLTSAERWRSSATGVFLNISSLQITHCMIEMIHFFTLVVSCFVAIIDSGLAEYGIS